MSHIEGITETNPLHKFDIEKLQAMSVSKEIQELLETSAFYREGRPRNGLTAQVEPESRQVEQQIEESKAKIIKQIKSGNPRREEVKLNGVELKLETMEELIYFGSKLVNDIKEAAEI